MATLYPVAGSVIEIGSRVEPKGTLTPADFTGQVWVKIGGWTNAGAFGDTQEVITQNFIEEARTRKAKGTKDAGTMENQFVPIGNDPGQLAFEEAMEDCKPYAFRVTSGANCPRESTVTISVAEPGVVSWTAHGLANGSPIVFTVSSGGALPTGLTAGVTYYVVAAAADSFSVAATPGGTGIQTTAAGSGTITAIAGEVGSVRMFYGYAIGGALQGGDANTIQLVNYSIAIDSNIVRV